MATETKRNVTKHSVDNVVVVWLALPMLCLCLACATFQAVGERERERDEEIRLHSPELSWASRLRSWLRKESRGYRRCVASTEVVEGLAHSHRELPAPRSLPVKKSLFSLRFSVSFLFFLSLHLVGFVSRSARNSWFVFNMTRTLLVGSCPLHRFRESNTRARIIFRGKRMV